MQCKALYFIVFLTLTTRSLSPSPTIETPTIIKIKGLEPINHALDQTNQALDKINIMVDNTVNTVNKLANIPHMIGIMILGISFCSLGLYRFQKQETSNDWHQKLANGLLITGGFLLTLTAPIITSKMNRITI